MTYFLATMIKSLLLICTTVNGCLWNKQFTRNQLVLKDIAGFLKSKKKKDNSRIIHLPTRHSESML